MLRRFMQDLVWRIEGFLTYKADTLIYDGQGEKRSDLLTALSDTGSIAESELNSEKMSAPAVDELETAFQVSSIIFVFKDS